MVCVSLLPAIFLTGSNWITWTKRKWWMFLVVVPEAAAEFARPVGTAVAEPEVAAHCLELEPQWGAPRP